MIFLLTVPLEIWWKLKKILPVLLLFEDIQEAEVSSLYKLQSKACHVENSWIKNRKLGAQKRE